MARGKEALLAANRRVTAAHEVIDRLTSEVVDAKLRARIAEQRIQQLEPKAARTDELEANHRDDLLLAEALEALSAWRKRRREDDERQKAALKEIGERMIPDVRTWVSPPLGSLDARDFIFRRYPRVMDALTDGWGIQAHELPSPYASPTFHKLGADNRKRLDRIRGKRACPEWDHDADMAFVLADVLDAKQIGLTSEEIHELLGFEPSKLDNS